MFNSYNKILSFKNNKISNILKDFTNSNIDTQFNTIKLLLLMKNDIKYQCIIDLLYDMINNETFTINQHYLCDYLYNNLNYNLQHLLKNNYKNITNYKNKLDCNINISYEKQIYLLNVSDNIKQKALEKLNEINNKGNDNSYKAQQYLDSLLKIPFNIYKKEYIFNYLDNFKKDIHILINSIINFCEINNHTLFNKLYSLCNNNLNKHMLFENINKFINTINNINNEILLELNINKLIDFFINNSSVKEIKNSIIYINTHKLSPIKVNNTKKKYGNDIKKLLKSNIDLNIKYKIITIINNICKNINTPYIKSGNDINTHIK